MKGAETDAKKQPPPAIPHVANRKAALLCGLHAVNALLRLYNKPLLERTQIDSINDAISIEEAAIRADRHAVDTHRQAEGNYALDVLAATIKVYAELELEKATIDDNGIPRHGTYLAGRRNRAQRT